MHDDECRQDDVPIERRSDVPIERRSRVDPEHADASSAPRSGFSPDAVRTMRRALAAGGGGMAQFDHPEFGGVGQWMRGGMVMTSIGGDPTLRARIDRLCEALDRPDTVRPSSDGRAAPIFQSQSQTSGGRASTQDARTRWWPAALGVPEGSGAQDGLRYAWFGASRRLLVEEEGRITAYDTASHRLSGVAQQQGGSRGLTFTDDRGPLDLSLLAVVDAEDGPPLVHGRPEPVPDATAGLETGAAAVEGTGSPAPADPFVALERLAALHARGIVSDGEFAAKKSELLARI